MIDIKVPTVGESISEVTLVKWLKKDGDYVERDEVIAELESEKATFEVNAEKAGSIKNSRQKKEILLNIGDVLAQIDEAAAKPATAKHRSSRIFTNRLQPTDKTHRLPKKLPKQLLCTSQTQDVKATPVASAMIADKKD